MRAARFGWTALVALILGSVLARAEDASIDDATLRAARRVLPGVVRIQWRGRGERPTVVERHAIVVDADGWLLLAGPPPPEEGTLAATFHDGRSMSARVWAHDARSALTLLRLPVTGLKALEVRDVVAADGGGMVPPRLRPGTSLTMVTAEGAVARGTLRGSHRRRLVGRPGSSPTEVTCLDEAALNVVRTDLGAPWIDRRGRVLGLLIGADVTVPRVEAADGERLRPRPEVVAAYAVPGPVLQTVWPLLRDRRRVPRSALGVWTDPLSELLQRHVCRDCGGRVVIDVEARGAADRAGLVPNDIIRKVADQPLAPDATLGDVLLRYRPGERITLGILRAGEDKVLETVLDATD